ncbi:MAG TPA: hypothetical protein VG754_13585 [Verrucomicrobiae bacterium]|jgi:hypothetical protein|nr:hypothetical protein [Verrucomicrobiae bacterium]
MRTVEEIKAAAAALDPDEQVELFRWWVQTDVFKKRQLAALKKEIAKGVDDLKDGRYQTYTDSNVMQLREDIGKSGRERLKAMNRKKRS